jgi:hypothetical protein
MSSAVTSTSEFDAPPMAPGLQVADCIDSRGDLTVLAGDGSIWLGVRHSVSVYDPRQYPEYDWSKIADGPPGITSATKLLLGSIGTVRIVADGRLYERRKEHINSSRLFAEWHWVQINIPMEG